MQIEIKKVKSIEVKDDRVCVEIDGTPARVEIDIKEIKDIGFNVKKPEKEEETK